MSAYDPPVGVAKSKVHTVFRSRTLFQQLCGVFEGGDGAGGLAGGGEDGPPCDGRRQVGLWSEPRANPGSLALLGCPPRVHLDTSAVCGSTGIELIGWMKMGLRR
jgi:hypothetical protein